MGIKMNNNNNNNNNKRGRKPKDISFHFAKNRPFTVGDIYNRYLKDRTRKLTRVAIMMRLKQMVKENRAKLIGKKDRDGRGRKEFLFKLIKNANRN